eukprot:CAMPEP_0184398258 /NCGR_PEP_ID=MMETSP0007-20130409/64775_1 /TAXON_ID=97485 /ORGANISM="Prymnesium parvum, Strain Texoma1" /LENGTH=37 /DNA_ID= /DNA_START= /DNA_END= /DNA_ORIENTATION=
MRLPPENAAGRLVEARCEEPAPDNSMIHDKGAKSMQL